MLRIQKLSHLARNFRFSQNRIFRTAENIQKYIQEYLLFDPNRPDKVRKVFSVNGDLRTLQARILGRISKYDFPAKTSHGSIKNRSIFTNASAHRNSSFAYKTDIASFYPSIHRNRVYRYFWKAHSCAPDVARILTRLTTFNHHVPLGLLTSPIIADRILKDVDKRIQYACAQNKIIYTRFVDDIVLSADFDLSNSGFPNLVRRVLESNGFHVNESKDEFCDLQEGLTVTGIRIRNGKFDVTQDFILKLEHQISVAESLEKGALVDDVYSTQSQIRGKLFFVKKLNKFRFRQLTLRCNRIDWESAMQNAQKQGLVMNKKQLTKVSGNGKGVGLAL